jgi:predicted nucleotide-binding protein (sugar kinase/HSP70/actin superfamily)
VLKADAAIVETVAHTEAALHFYPDADVICDVGGQDIKLIILQDGRVKDFKLNTQCSAGNGYFLQSTCTGFGFEVTQFADLAFSAQSMPMFGYGCAVFMQSDIVDFQRQGWKPEEILAGLAAVLPKNIWLYVSQIANLASLGRTFVLQGGTQHNLAAVKAQVDFIESRFKDKGVQPKVIVHEHCGESGAIGAAIEAQRLWSVMGRQTSFIGLEAVQRISYNSHRNENTRCYFCKNKCLRTFVDVKVSEVDDVENVGSKTSKIPILPGVKRLIVGNSCERGLVEDVNAMREIKKGMDAMRDANPNMAEVAAKAAFRSFAPLPIADPLPKLAFTAAQKARAEAIKRRATLRIGIPKVLNQYSVNPMFSAYFEALGVQPENIVYSDYTSEELYKSGAKRGAIDPCFPSKVGIPHVHNLLYVHHRKKPLDVIFFPMIDDLPSDLKHAQEHRACPTVTATPAAVKAAFTKEGDLFAENAIKYLNPIINTADQALFARQMWLEFRDILGLSADEHGRAVGEAFKAQQKFMADLRREGRAILERLEAEDGIGIVLLARPYHNDPGLNHEILEEFQKLGYPVLTMAALPIDEDIIWRLFGEDVRAGAIQDPMDIGDVWKNSYSENTSQKVWAAKYTARHPNLVALELSSFKCGHDAPIYTVVEETVTSSGTPYFSFKDIDENKPTGSIKIRVETISYFLKRYREDMVARRRKQTEIDAKLRDLEHRLRREMALEGELASETMAAD